MVWITRVVATWLRVLCFQENQEGIPKGDQRHKVAHRQINAEDLQKLKVELTMVGIGYRKPYGILIHSWTVKSLETEWVGENILTFVRNCEGVKDDPDFRQ